MPRRVRRSCAPSARLRRAAFRGKRTDQHGLARVGKRQQDASLDLGVRDTVDRESGAVVLGVAPAAIPVWLEHLEIGVDDLVALLAVLVVVVAGQRGASDGGR